MKIFFSTIIATAALVGAAQAQVSDPMMTCEQYLELSAKAGPTPKTGDATMDKMAADIEAKMAAYCKANPKAKAIEAAEKAM